MFFFTVLIIHSNDGGMIIYKKIIFIFLLLYLSGCGNKIPEQMSKEAFVAPIQPKKINISIHRAILNSNQLIKPIIADVNDQKTIVYITRNNDSLIFEPLFKKEADSISYGFKLSNSSLANLLPGKVLFTVYHNQIFFLATRFGVLYIYDIDANYNLHLIKKINLIKYLKENSLFIRFVYNQGLKVFGDNVYIPFGKSSSWRNFTHKYCYIKLNYTSNNMNFETVFETLPIYRKGMRHNKDTYLNEISNANLFIYSFRTYDRIDFFDRNNKIYKRISYSNNNFFLDFNKKESTDLSYVRYYETTNESNEAILTTDKKIIILKRKKKDKILAPNTYQYIILNGSKDFEKNYDYTFPFPIDPYFSFSYKKGFVVFADNLKGAFYYEIP